jgi:hypothetical protein
VTDYEIQQLDPTLIAKLTETFEGCLVLLDYVSRLMAMTSDRPAARPVNRAPLAPRALPPAPVCPVRITRGAREAPAEATADVLRADGTWEEGLRVTLHQAGLLDVLIAAYLGDPTSAVTTKAMNEATKLADPGAMLRRLCKTHPALAAVLARPGKKYRGCGWRLQMPA